MTAAEARPEHLDEAPERADRAFLGHPKGLGYLSAVEWCERFSYYSMQNLLALYMVNYLLPQRFSDVIGLGWLQQWRYGGAEGQVLASAIFGDYSSLVYLTPILGGLLADKWLGRRAALVAGAVVMSIGHFLMAFEGAFIFALATLIVGVGLFKGNIASQVGELYKPGDLRRAMAFQIFYIAINVSVIVAPFISGTLGEKVGWHYGFGCAGVVMVLGLLVYLKAGPWLPPDNKPTAENKAAREALTRNDWNRVIAVFVLVPVMAVALLTNQQIFNAYLVWADQQFDLNFFDYRIPTTWLMALDAALSFSMLVAVAAFWKWRANRTGTEPDELGKMVIGSFFTIAGGLCLVMATVTQGDAKIGLLWPFMFHLLNAIGFSHILPVSLALFTRLAPRQINATVVGIYYLAFFLANQIVGHVGGWYSSMDTAQFWLIHVATAAVGLVAFAAFKMFLAERLMGENEFEPTAA
ncbi:MFS transporter [Altererythrobacter salegens]|uniref:MFS transporter n=1 Tax=Croceibacterium salegens TaxID=1737568 RepID=A0A6I4SXJ4_9SPHN|nr:peptide MFS transporter [Croceibacterium salegens]MXO60059.1 MFS transporter [Croceibacterium salegens]